MTTTNETPIQKIEADVKDVYTFTKSHLILVACLFLAIVGLVYQFDSRRADRANAKTEVAMQQAKDAQAAAQAAIAQTAQINAQDQAKEQAADQRVAQLQIEIDSLTKAIAANNAALVVQQKTDATMPPTQLSAHWSDVVKIPNSVQPQPNGNYVVTQPAAVATVQALDSIPTLTVNNADLSKQVADQVEQLAQDQTIISLKTQQIATDQSSCTAQLVAKDAVIKSDTDEIANVKAQAKKKSLKYFLLGGFVVEAVKIVITKSF